MVSLIRCSSALLFIHLSIHFFAKENQKKNETIIASSSGQRAAINKYIWTIQKTTESKCSVKQPKPWFLVVVNWLCGVYTSHAKWYTSAHDPISTMEWPNKIRFMLFRFALPYTCISNRINWMRFSVLPYFFFSIKIIQKNTLKI